MKHHIALKFVAVLLCAASLLGSLASAAGILVLTEGDLYNKSVDQLKEERLLDFGTFLAGRLASAYASRTLGGCPEDMVTDAYGRWKGGALKENAYGYILVNEDGHTLDIYNDAITEDPGAAYYEIPAQGSYMKLYDLLTWEQMNPQQTQPDQTAIWYHTLKEWETSIGRYSVTFADGSSYGDNYNQGQLGKAWILDGQVHCQLEMNENVPTGVLMTHIVLWDDRGSVVYEAMNEEGVGSFETALEDGTAVLLYRYPGDTGQEPYIYDAVSPQGQDVYGMNFTVDDSGSCGVSSDDPIGRLSYEEDGHLWFRGSLPGLVDDRESSGVITKISFLDAGGAILYEARSPEGVGNFMFNGSNVPTFYCSIPANVSAGPQITKTDVWQVEIFQANGERLYAAESPQDAALGQFWYDSDGYANLTICFAGLSSWHEIGELSQGRIGAILIRDSQGNIIFSGEEGFVFVNTDGYTYQSAVPVDTVPSAGAERKPAQRDSAEQQQTAVPEQTDGAEETAAAPETVPPEQATLPMETVLETTIPETTEAENGPGETTMASSASAPVTDTSSASVTEPTVGFTVESEDLDTYCYYDRELGQDMYARYASLPLPGYTLKLYLLPDAYTYGPAYEVLEVLRHYRSDLFLVLGACLLLLAIFTVYLCCTAGKKPGTTEIRAGGLNALPLDLYTAITAGCICGIVVLGVEGSEHFFRQKMEVAIVYAGAAAYAACLVIVGFFFAFVAQLKTPRHYWLNNTIVVRLLRRLVRLAIRTETWLSQKGGPSLVKLVKKLWSVSVKLLKKLWSFTDKTVRWALKTCKCLWHWFAVRVNGILGWLGRSIQRFLALLPLTWQWVLGGMALILAGSLTFANRRDGWGFLWFLVGLALTLYVSHCFGNLWESTKRMSKGDLDTKVDDKLLAGCFKDFAGDLNDLADVAVVAAQKQLKSERMKTELITNVSHDIKTPLTSIINYVDLLQKPHTESEQEQYLEVLNRQSLRLKKLIDDLMEMSKASTGNMAVDITRLDAVESVNQALGEFSDKLEKAQLSPVFRHTEDTVPMMADGRMVWRVMSNVLSNAVKYAMPGTRLYIDLMSLEGKVVISIKNISREELTLDAEELMERFVRGDDSRNTEGSGLGLNIAKSLMELQKGQLQLLVDGDLFKVTLIFPGV